MRPRNPMTAVGIDRRSVLAGVGAGCLLAALPSEARSTLLRSPRGSTGGYVSARDGTQIFFKDWGEGPPVVFSHGWPLNADAWDDQMYFLASRGFRCIAFDRRGHGRSGPAWNGHDYDTFGDDLKVLLDQLDLKDVICSSVIRRAAVTSQDISDIKGPGGSEKWFWFRPSRR